MKIKLTYVAFIVLNEWHLAAYNSFGLRVLTQWFKTKPTARQIRKFKKEAKQWL